MSLHDRKRSDFPRTYTYHLSPLFFARRQVTCQLEVSGVFQLLTRRCDSVQPRNSKADLDVWEQLFVSDLSPELLLRAVEASPSLLRQALVAPSTAAQHPDVAIF